MSRLKNVIEQRKAKSEKVFVAYITAGDPDLEVTAQLVLTLAHAGVDIIELGVPFSDPLADGPINQRAAERGLASGTSLTKILATVAELRRRNQEIAIVIFSYLNPIYRLGFAKFAEAAREAGVDGVLIVDFPPEEAEAYRLLMQAQGLDTIFLASPTSDVERLQHIDAQSSGFVYYVSRTGVTGMQAQLSATLSVEMEQVKRVLRKPVMVGFGISDGSQAVAAAALGDGIVIGSALVKIIEEAQDPAERVCKVEAFARSIRSSLDAVYQRP